MADYKNMITLGIQLTSSQELQKELNNTISKLEKDSKKLGLDFDNKNAKTSIEYISNMVTSLRSKIGSGISLGDFSEVVSSLQKVDGELLKISNVKIGDNLILQTTKVASAIGQIVEETKKLEIDNSGNILNSMSVGNPKTTTNLKEYNKALIDIGKSQEKLMSLNLVDEGKKFDLQNALNVSNLSMHSVSDLQELLNQVKKLEEEEKNLQKIQSEQNKQTTQDRTNMYKDMFDYIEKREKDYSKLFDEADKNMSNKKNQDAKLNNDEYLSNQRKAYSELSNLQKEEYSLKEKLISAEGEYKQKLEERLVEVNLLKNAQKQDINNNNLANIQKENDLIQQGTKLQEQFNQAKSKNNDNITNKINQESQAYQEEQKQVQLLIQNKIKLLEISKQSLVRKNGKDFDTSEIDSYISKLKSLDNVSLKELKNEFTNIDTGMKQLRENAQSSETMFNRLSNSLRGIGLYLDIGDIVRGVSNTIRTATDSVIEFDNALIDLKKVANETNQAYSQFLNTAHDIAMDYGSQADKVTEATTSWAKTGESLKNATELAKSTLMLTKVGDVDSIATAQQYMLPSLKAFNIEADKSIELVDKYNNLSNNMATEVPQLGEAVSKASSSMATAGNSLEQTLALLATAQSQTQLSGSTIGQAFKTLSLRIATFSEENGELIPEFEKKLGKLGITMRDAQGQILSTFDILNQVGTKFKSWDKNTQLDVAQLLGGKLQANVISAVVNNVGELNRAYDLASNSAGSAINEFKTYQEGVQYSIDRLKESVQNFYRSSINSSALKGLIDGLTTLISTFGNLPSIIGLATTALLLFKGSMITDLLAVTAGETAMSVATVGLTSVMNGLKLAFATNPIGMIALACTGAVIGLTALNKKLKESTDYIGKLNNTTNELQENQTTETLINQYEQLTKKINDSKTPTSELAKAKEDLVSVQKQLAEQFPNLVDGYTKEGDAIIRNIGLIKDKVSEDKKALLKTSNDNYDNAMSQINSETTFDTSKNDKWYSGFLVRYTSELKEYNTLVNSSNKLNSIQEEELNRLSTKFGDLNKAVLTIKENGQDISGKQMFNFDTGQFEDAETYLKNIETQSVSTTDTMKNGFDETTKAVESTDDKLKKLSDTFNGMSSQVGIIDQVVKELKEYKGITEDTYGKLIQSHPEVLATLVKEGDTISNLTQLRDKDKQQMESAKESAVQLANEQYNTVLSNNQGEMQSNEEKNTNKVNSDAEANSQIQDNNADTVDKNGENYVKDGKNFDGITQSKITSDGGVGTAMTTNMSNTVNALSDLYLKDYINFENQTRSKMNLLDQLKSQLGSSASELIQNANTLDDVVGIRMADKMSLPTNDEITTDVGKSFGVQLKAYGEAFKKASDSIKTELKSELPEMIKAEPTMIANPTSGSKGSGSKGSSSADKAQKDAEKALKEAVERDKKLLSEITDAYDDAKNSISDNLKDIELNEQLLGDADNSNYADRVKLANERVVEQSKALDSANKQLMALENTTVETEDGQKSLADALKKANTELKNQKLELVKLQQTALKVAVERDKALLQEITDAYSDAKNSITDNLKEIELNEQLLGKADNSNYIDRVKLANDRIIEQSKVLDRANQQLMALESTSVNTSEGQQNLAESIKKANIEIKTQKAEVAKLQQTLQDLAENQIQQLLKKEKELKDLELNAKQNKETEDLKKYTKEQEEAHNSRLDNLNEEMDALEKQKDIEDQEVKIAELKADIEEKKANLIEKQNDLKQKQIDLERAQNQKTIYEYTKQEDGSYQFVWSANKDTIKSAKDSVDSAQKDVDSAEDSVKDSKEALLKYYEELDYKASKKAIQDKIDEENAKYKITQDFLSKKSEALQKQQDIEKKQLEYHYKDIDKLSKDYLAGLNQQYGDNWSGIATAINTNLTTIETRFNKLNELNVNYGLDSVYDAMNSSKLDSYIIKRKESIQDEVDATTEALNQQLSNLVSYNDEMEKEKTESTTNMINTQQAYSDDSVKLQNDTNATKLLNQLEYLQSQNQLTEGMLNTLHLIYDEAWGDIVDVTTLSVEEMLKQLQVMKGIHDKFVAMWNNMHKEDEWKDKVSISSNMSEWNAYKNGQKDYISAKELLNGIGSNSLSKTGRLDTSGLSSISLGNNGMSMLMPSTTNNSNSSVNHYSFGDISVNADNANDFLSSMLNFAKQNAKTSR